MFFFEDWVNLNGCMMGSVLWRVVKYMFIIKLILIVVFTRVFHTNADLRMELNEAVDVSIG